MDRIHNNRSLIPPKSRQLKTQQKNQTGTKDFKDLLKSKLKTSQLKFSKHAQKRIDARNMQLKEQDLAKLNQAVEKARDKGATESLIMVNNNAYVVSVENETVITAMDQESLEENVFTNIDSAVIMK